MAVDTRPAWANQLETALRTLRDVESVSVQLEGAEVRELHVLTSSQRSPKQIVRDIQTLLLTRFGKTIDHRVVSVAYTRASTSTDEPPAVLAVPRPAAFTPVESAPAPSPPTTPATAPRRDAGSKPATEGRIRFASVNLYVSGPRAQAQVELRWKGITRMGSATGTATREGSYGLVAAAAVAAISEFLADDWGLSVLGVDFVKLAKKDAAVVGLTLLSHRQEKTLVGCCSVEQDVPQAVALATLAALNRVVGGLETREPTEYVLRPASTQEASEAR